VSLAWTLAAAGHHHGAPLTAFQALLLWGGIALFVTLVGAMLAVHSQHYRRHGYPPSPRWMGRIMATDDLDAVQKKLAPAFQEGFEIRQRDERWLVIEKTFVDPACVMTVEYYRKGRFTWQKLSVVCVNHKWLNWSWSTGGHRSQWPTRRPHPPSPETAPTGTSPEGSREETGESA